MMKKKQYTLLILILSLLLYAFSSSYYDKEKMIEKVNLYSNNIIKLFMPDGNFADKYGKIHALFEEGLEEHFNEFNPSSTRLDSYLSDVQKNLNKNIKVEFSDVNIYPCAFYDNKSSKSYGVATLKKTVNINGDTKQYNILLQINLDNYKIYGVYQKETNINLLPNCSISGESNSDVSKEKQLVTRQYLKSADNYYRKKDYIHAKEMYELALKSEPNSARANEGILNCKRFIDSNKYKTLIENLMQREEYNDAIDKIKNAKKSGYYVAENGWFDKKLQICKEKLRITEFKRLISSADYFYQNKMFNKAKKLYRKALTYNINNSYVNKQIELCNEGDPSYVKRKIQEAYDAAVKSKKNWYNTFKTYLKYEDSGFLTGEHYYFMTLMMLENKSVARKMGYSKSFASSLSVEYYFKSKRLGCSKCDMAFLENQVFTKSIYNHKQ